ncbi:MAG: putative DNA binding domain-containing protein [Candidatus Aminicenantes bacterium]|nr:putative DNA binding domain-containing protein [Candidatus Aminicenantes bacterium]
MTEKSIVYLIDLVNELRKLPAETGWVEFKHNNVDPAEIGEYISALSNSAALLGKPNAYLIWGIDNLHHAIIGTEFSPQLQKVGNEELENWLLRLLSPKINFRFYRLMMDGKSVILLEIDAAFKHPVQFQNQEFIRVGSYKKKLKDFQEKERELWRCLDRTPFEAQIALEHQSAEQVMKLLDYPDYFDLLELPLPDGHASILEALANDELITVCPAGGYNITNLGALLFARKLDDFPKLKRKAMRVILYRGKGRIETQKEYVESKGYATGFDGLIKYVMALVPANEVIQNAFRKSIRMYPEPAIRELAANALIHQDFFETGTGPMIELFDDRIEITNPGEPLVAVNRFLDTPPKSRNEKIASLMRRFRICEERGSGIDKVVIQTELYQLPAPLFEVPDGFTRTVLFSHKSIDDMSKEDRMRACYLHACLQYVQRQNMTNKSLRDRFGLDESKGGQISRIINATLETGMIKRISQSESRRDSAYVPFWSSSREYGS